MADIDRFKLVNDRYGHAVGDAVLQAIAAALRSRVRSTDVLARVGGEEFALLLPNTELGGGSQVAEELRAAVEELAVASPAGTLRVTISVGVAHSSAPEPPLQAADAALYKAKNSGRNRVVTHQPVEDPPAG